MKKRLLILVLVTAVTSSLLFNVNNVHADVSQCIFKAGSSSTTTKEYCAGSLYRAMNSTYKSYCKIKNPSGPSDASNVSSCISYIKQRTTCDIPGSNGCPSSVNSEKETYASSVRTIIANKDVHPCANVNTSQGGAYDGCRKQEGHWQYYYNTNPNTSSNTTPGNNTSTPGNNTSTPGNNSGYNGGGNNGGGNNSGGNTTPGNNSGYNGGGNTIAPVDEGDCTSILPNSWCNSEDGISSIISFVISILTGAVIVAGTVGIVICGFMWMSARDNEGQVAMAKKRILDIVIGIIAWVLLAFLANLFIPKSSGEIDSEISVSTSRRK